MKLCVYDNVVSKRDNDVYRDLLLKGPFYYGAIDGPNSKPSGLINGFWDLDMKLYPQLKTIREFYLNKIYQIEPSFKKRPIGVERLNLFLPGENPEFHTDHKDWITCMFYINPELSINEGGETQFHSKENFHCVSSKPGRLVIFDGGIEHRATSFRTHPRLTLVFSFVKLS
jgi:hypothetical protein